MKTVFRTLVLLLLALSLTLALLSCTNKKETPQEESDDWMTGTVVTDKTNYAYQQKFNDKNDPASGAMTSDERVNLPSIKR